MDKRIVMGTLVLPGVMLFAVYYLFSMIDDGGMTSELAGTKGVQTSLMTESGGIFSTIIPVVLIIFLFIGCISAATESVAGEKERGTIWTVLVTPVKRTSLALGKVCALSVIAILSAISSSIGMVMALCLMGDSYGEIVCMTSYGIKGYAAMFMIITVTAVMVVGFIAVLSMFGKSVREAQVFSMPLIILAAAVCVVSVMNSGAVREIYVYGIPLYNSVSCLTDIMAGTEDRVGVLFTLVCNIICSGVFILLISKLYRSERCI